MSRARCNIYRKFVDEVGSDTANEDLHEQHDQEDGIHDTLEKHGEQVQRLTLDGNTSVGRGTGGGQRIGSIGTKPILPTLTTSMTRCQTLPLISHVRLKGRAHGVPLRAMLRLRRLPTMCATTNQSQLTLNMRFWAVRALTSS